MCVFTTTSVSSKMAAYLYKFTNSHYVSLVLPCIISIVQVVGANGNIGIVNTVANYVAEFFAYQFIAIIPFGLWYLRSAQLTVPAETQNLAQEPDRNDDQDALKTLLDKGTLSVETNLNESTFDG